LIENLPTPLKVFATSSTQSAQSAAGVDDPRVLIVNGSLVLTVVSAGPTSNELEISQLISSTESVKAQINFPVTANIPVTEPYDTVKLQSGTSCRFCHSGERAVSGYAGDAFASAIMRPDPSLRQTSSRMR
jgi:hypothetical protein